jgi:tetratricopeptide (TPR) repeat protein
MYIAKQAKDKLKGDDYAEMAKMYLKFPGEADKAEALVEQAVSLDTVVDNKISYMKGIADAYAAQSDWKGNYKWLDKIDQINPRRTAVNYYYLADAAYKSAQFNESMKVSAKYISAYPDQIQGYSMQRRAAVAADPDTSNGLALPAIDQYTVFLMNDKESNKFRILENHGYKIYYYLIKSREYDKALQSSIAILELDPANDYGLQAKAEAERLIKANGGEVKSSPTKTDSSSKTVKTGTSGNQ